MATQRGRSSRKKKSLAEWAKEHPDDLEAKIKAGRSDCDSSEVLVCKFCAVELNISSGKKPWNKINEHFKSKCHKRMKGRETAYSV